MLADVETVLRHIQPIDPEWICRAELRQASLTKPPGSLGRLEEVANRVVAIQRSLTPTVEHACIVIFAADHGVTAERVAPYPSAVTGQMVANLLAGGAGVNALARVARLPGARSARPAPPNCSGRARGLGRPSTILPLRRVTLRGVLRASRIFCKLRPLRRPRREALRPA